MGIMNPTMHGTSPLPPMYAVILFNKFSIQSGTKVSYLVSKMYTEVHCRVFVLRSEFTKLFRIRFE
jgi:hypothetical protein